MMNPLYSPPAWLFMFTVPSTALHMLPFVLVINAIIKIQNWTRVGAGEGLWFMVPLVAIVYITTFLIGRLIRRFIHNKIFLDSLCVHFVGVIAWGIYIGLSSPAIRVLICGWDPGFIPETAWRCRYAATATPVYMGTLIVSSIFSAWLLFWPAAKKLYTKTPVTSKK